MDAVGQPEGFCVGAVRSSANVNEDFTDAGAEITNTVPTDGQAGMTGQLRAAFGSPAAPGIAFAADRNVGFRRRAADCMSWVVAAQDAFYIDADGKAYLRGLDSTGTFTVNGSVDGASDCGQLEALAGTGLARRTASTVSLDDGTFTIPVIFDSNGGKLGAARACDMLVPCDCTLTSIGLQGDTAGSCSLNIFKASYTSFPTISNSIVGGNPPTMSNVSGYLDASLSGWTTSIAANDILRFYLTSVTGLGRLTVSLQAKRYA